MKHFITLNMLIGFIILHGMDTPPKQPKKALTKKPIEKTFDMWEFFSEPNHLDRMLSPIPFWSKEKTCSIEKAAQLSILERNNVNTQNLSVLDATCSKDHSVYFLGQMRVAGCSNNDEALYGARQQYAIGSFDLLKKPFIRNAYDTIVSCHPIEYALFKVLLLCLKPQGEIVCLLNTQSNEQSIESKALVDSYPAINKHSIYKTVGPHKMKLNIPPNDFIKKMITDASCEIITYKNEVCDTLIQDKKSFLQHCRNSFLTSSHVKCISSPQNLEKLANFFVSNIIKHVKKDVVGNWFFPYSCTFVHIKKQF
jgi:hypothetical protein